MEGNERQIEVSKPSAECPGEACNVAASEVDAGVWVVSKE